jgi:hypothetical protein
LLQTPVTIRSTKSPCLAPKGLPKSRWLAGLIAMGLPWASPVLAGPLPVPPETPQAVVECLGAHALCNASIDCQRQGTSKALCPCWNVNERHLVQTEKIQDELVRLETQRRCSKGSPCGVDEAPVCRVIREGRYRVDKVTYPGVSTFSYRGWCQTFRPVSCEAKSGPWADCMAAPCQRNPNNPDRPWTCQCRIQNEAFVGINGRCDSPAGQVMSTFERPLWNFNTGAFSVPLPGNEFVNIGACRFLRSDH